MYPYQVPNPNVSSDGVIKSNYLSNPPKSYITKRNGNREI